MLPVTPLGVGSLAQEILDGLYVAVLCRTVQRRRGALHRDGHPTLARIQVRISRVGRVHRQFYPADVQAALFHQVAQHGDAVQVVVPRLGRGGGDEGRGRVVQPAHAPEGVVEGGGLAVGGEEVQQGILLVPGGEDGSDGGSCLLGVAQEVNEVGGALGAGEARGLQELGQVRRKPVVSYELEENLVGETPVFVVEGGDKHGEEVAFRGWAQGDEVARHVLVLVHQRGQHHDLAEVCLP